MTNRIQDLYDERFVCISNALRASPATRSTIQIAYLLGTRDILKLITEELLLRDGQPLEALLAGLFADAEKITNEIIGSF